jgi:hypothetical protein
MHDTGSALAEPDDARLPSLGAGSGLPERLPVLIDTRLVRLELTRLRTPRERSRAAGLAGSLIARSSGMSNVGREC